MVNWAHPTDPEAAAQRLMTVIRKKEGDGVFCSVAIFVWDAIEGCHASLIPSNSSTKVAPLPIPLAPSEAPYLEMFDFSSDPINGRYRIATKKNYYYVL